jgi:hypothetical protein
MGNGKKPTPPSLIQIPWENDSELFHPRGYKYAVEDELPLLPRPDTAFSVHIYADS